VLCLKEQALLESVRRRLELLKASSKRASTTDDLLRASAYLICQYLLYLAFISLEIRRVGKLCLLVDYSNDRTFLLRV
jgi:hypothetical protein